MFDPQSHAYYFAMLFVGPMLLIKDGFACRGKEDFPPGAGAANHYLSSSSSARDGTAGKVF